MQKKHAGIFIMIAIILLALGAGGCFLVGGSGRLPSDSASSDLADKDTMTGGAGSQEKGEGGEAAEGKTSLICASGDTLETRILPPDGYERVSENEDSLAVFLRTYPMKKDGSKVLLYNGKKKKNQDAHAAVFKLPIEDEDLQQCADSVMRVYAEYYWNTDQKEKIAFHFVDGFLAEYSKWQQGYRIQVSDSGSAWVKSASADSSYESFQKYLRVVFSYASTLSLEQESKKIKLAKIRAGDIFIKGGSPGHVVMVVDVCENAEGEKAFLLAQGYMPAQEFHVLKNPMHEEDPWYYADEVSYPFQTPEYTFDRGSLRRPEYE